MKIKIIYIVIFCFTLLFLSACRKEHEHNCEEVIIDPTCTTDGYKIIKCCCNPEYKIILNKTGHNYIDGICTYCSLKETIDVLVINNGSTYTITLNYGEVIEIENYEFLSIDDQLFKGWYLNDELFDFSNPVKSNITLTAKYNNSEQFYNIEYVIDDSYLYYSSKQELLNDFLNDFYEFVKPDISFKAFAYGLEGSLPLWTFFIGGNYSDINKLIYNNDIDAKNENYFFNCSKYKDKWYMLSSYMKNNICKSNKRFGYKDVEYNYGALDFYRYLVNDPGNYLSTYGGEKVFYSYPLNEVSMVSTFEYNSGIIDLYIPSNNSFKGWYKDESFTDGPYITIDTNYIGSAYGGYPWFHKRIARSERPCRFRR